MPLSPEPLSVGPIGVVLAGGRSRRFGSDKALAELGPESLARRAARTLREVVDEVVVADRGQALVPGFLSIPDARDAGPAGGLLGVRNARPGRRIVALACDLPFVPPALLQRLVDGLANHDWVLPWTEGGPEPAVAAWTPRALEVLARRVAAGQLALRGLLDETVEASPDSSDPPSDLTDDDGPQPLRIERLAGPTLLRFGDPERLFLNVNRQGDLDRARRLLESPCGTTHCGDTLKDR